MKLTCQYYTDRSKGHCVTADDESMVPFLEKLIEIADSSHLKIYYREYNTESYNAIYLYGIMPELKHVVSLANSSGDRRIWLEHRFQKSMGEDVVPINIVSDEQIEVFDRVVEAWLRAGKDVRQSDAAVVEEIMRLK